MSTKPHITDAKKHLNQIFSSRNTLKELELKKREIEDTISIVVNESIKAKDDLGQSMEDFMVCYVELKGVFEGLYRVEKISGIEYAIDKIDHKIIK